MSKLLIMTMTVAVAVWTATANAAPINKPVSATNLLLQFALAAPPAGCQMPSVIDGSNIDKAESYPIMLLDQTGRSDAIVLSKSTMGTVTFDPDDENTLFVWSFSEGGRDLKMIGRRNAKEMSFISIAKVSCGAQP